MRTEHLIGLTFIAALIGAPYSIAESRDAPSLQTVEPPAEVIVQGRVVNETAEPLPQKPGIVVLASHWTYHIRVTYVISGSVTMQEITAFRDSDPALREDQDFIFHLSRRSDGSYDLVKVDRIG